MLDTTTKTAEVKKKSNPIVLIAIVAVLGGGGFAAWKFLAHPAAAAEAKENGKEKSDDEAPRKKSKKKQVKSTVHLDSFVVNLTGEGETGYLRVGIDLGTDTEEASGEGEKKKDNGQTAMIRDTVLTVLGKTKSADLLSPEGKEKLKKELIEALDERVPDLGVLEVYFTEFIVQR